jgi:hypothetical protein
MEEIFKNFEAKKAEVLKQSETKEGGLSPEKEKEILKNAVYEKVMNATYTPIQQQAVQQQAQKLKDEPKERQIELLTQMAFDKGVVEAVGVAKNLNNPYLLDEFHDVLVDRLYGKLVEKGKLKQI